MRSIREVLEKEANKIDKINDYDCRIRPVESQQRQQCI